MRTGFGLMCKPPRPGVSKTRLAAVLGEARAAQIAAAFLQDSAELLAEVAARFGAARRAFVAPGDAVAELGALLPGWPCTPQPTGDLGARMAAAFAQLFDDGAEAAVLTGTDAPTLPPALLELLPAAIARGADAALIPAQDGGYCAIALGRAQPRLLQDMPWSTPGLLAATQARAAEAGLRLEILDSWFDVDEAPDLALLRESLAGLAPAAASPLPPFRASATRAALARLPSP
ncbi:MAG: TIGR04282 family arsenosugar biosynthesis glycosyltransferase [Rubritepida sp.]|jgi:hypothetical protein|nr:TIGR04282 family arsenosugar biosynthesis glycosyltransferase [Rubritepida sp.]